MPDRQQQIVAATRALRGPVTNEMADRLDKAGFHGVAAVARKYAVDRPRWWHRFTRSTNA